MNITLAGPHTIAFFKNISSKTADGGLVYMGGGEVAPAPREPGVHPGRWICPGRHEASTNGGPGHFLAVATAGASPSVSPGDVCVLVQQGLHTHLCVVASEDHDVGNPSLVDYRHFRWLFVLAMGEHDIARDGQASWFRPGWKFQSFANSGLLNKETYRHHVWDAFGLSEGVVSVPVAPTATILSAPATYP
jgi:hypothetical protein